MKKEGNVIQVVINLAKWIFGGCKNVIKTCTEGWNDLEKPFKAVRAISFWGMIFFTVLLFPISLLGVIAIAYYHHSIAFILFQLILYTNVLGLMLSYLAFIYSIYKLD